MDEEQRCTEVTGSRFPDPRLATDEHGLIGYSKGINTDMLIDAYSHGIFPWPYEERAPIPWVSPPERGVIDFDSFHKPRRLDQFMRNMKWTMTVDRDFPGVIRGCAAQPRGGTWITNAIIRAYVALHRAGHAHSIECWDGERLVGGIYGVFTGGVFSAESMFFTESNASKVCLVRLVEHLSSIGLTWLDIEVVTPTTAKFGGREIPRDEFLDRIRDADCNVSFNPPRQRESPR